MKGEAITSAVGWFVAISGIVGTLAKVYIDLRKDRREEMDTKDKINDTLTVISSDLSEVKADVIELKITNDLLINGQLKSQRFVLQSEILTALKRGHMTQHELDEVTQLYNSYQSKGGNGTIEIMFEKFKQLPIEED